MIKITPAQVNKKKQFIKDYLSAKNAADGSKLDANANITNKNIATLEVELHKDVNIQINRSLMYDKIEELFGKDLAIEYTRQIEKHEIYANDESSLKPYTYGASEAIIVYIKDSPILTTFELLYAYYKNLPEECLDGKTGVWAKYPSNLYIDDINGKTKITRIVKKNRHRDLVRVKTRFGEDIIVTDNHPMIINKNNINETVEAIKSTGHFQYKKNIKPIFINTFIDTKKEFDYEDYGDYCISKRLDNTKVEGVLPKIYLSQELGYAVGFFIAEGNYVDVNKRALCISQNNQDTLKKIASFIYRSTGISGKIYKDKCPSHSDRQNTIYRLLYNSDFLTSLLRDYFGIQPHSFRKSLPLNLLETNKNFIDGLISGIIDGDGCISKTNKGFKYKTSNHYDTASISIRVASRTLATQISTLLKSFNFGVSSTYQEQNESAFGSFSSNYPIFGVNFGLTGDLYFKLSEKVNKNRSIITKKTRYPKELGIIKSSDIIKNKSYLDNFIYDITTESSQFICNNLQVHNCMSSSMYPFILHGMTKFGGESSAPKYIQSYCGGFINLAFILSSQFAGAIGTPEFLIFMDKFAQDDWGDDYLSMHTRELNELLQHVVYSLNQPAAARSFQSIFWNVSIFDKYFMESMFESFIYPDMTKPDFASIMKLQKHFLEWIGEERKKALLTFPVITASMLTDDKEPLDKDFSQFLATEMSKGNTFFIYQSDSVDSLSSCCRLRNELTDKTFSHTLGAGGVATGSINVITLNMNRLIQDNRDLKTEIEKIHKYQVAYRSIIEEFKQQGLLPVYEAGFISLDKQFLTIGINGIVEAAESLGLKADNNKKYKEWVKKQLRIIFNANKKAKEVYGFMFNTEFVPAENLGVKNAAWDTRDGYEVNRECYNSYFFPLEGDCISIVDKFTLHGKELTQYLDGGSALHLNLGEHLSKEQYLKLFNLASRLGCNFWTTNILTTICNSCGNIDKRTLKICPKCKGSDLDYATRIIGYIRRLSNFSSSRQREASKRHYHTINKEKL